MAGPPYLAVAGDDPVLEAALGADETVLESDGLVELSLNICAGRASSPRAGVRIRTPDRYELLLSKEGGEAGDRLRFRPRHPRASRKATA